ncbi:MOSC domain-containing protein [Roseateles saccharophilus]|uniref:MOSC domain-containing protein n=1 Tax=Roseateles saccharophilus TaxID=304 RepID=A0A4R3UFB8_ROSSA|nr:MOSC N-terminal beta barrel domain-containing protein [Roseateles saccharophilus]TCU87160.1 hypothetical protein EV671_104432 [Roseateles saccharophilus]
MADLVARITGLWRYPVKACAGEAVDALKLDADGWPEDDRGWAIADAAGELTWMGAHPRLALVKARLTPERLELQAGGRGLALPPDAGQPVELRAWNGERQDFDQFDGWDAGDDAAALLRATTGERLRLVRLSAEARRRPGLNALHLVGDGSLQAWQQALAQPLAGLAQRARPNLLLGAEAGGELPAFIEDILVEMRVGSLRLRRTTPCVRCVVPTVDPASGKTQPPALEALARLSAERAPGAPVQFGVYLNGSGAGWLGVGDRVELSLDFGNL